MKLLKSILAVMMMAVTLSLASCGSDNDGDGPDGDDSIESLIIGTWEYDENDDDSYLSYTFYKNGTYEAVDVQYGDVEEWSGDYKIFGKKVIMYFDGDDETEYFNVKEITRNKMIVYYDDITDTEIFIRKK